MATGADAVRAARQRILKVEYEFPSHVKVSRECRDLLAKILVPDPTKRMTIPVIQRHPWYLKDLPPGVAEMNDTLPQPSAGVQARLRALFFGRVKERCALFGRRMPTTPRVVGIPWPLVLHQLHHGHSCFPKSVQKMGACKL